MEGRCVCFPSVPDVIKSQVEPLEWVRSLFGTDGCFVVACSLNVSPPAQKGRS